MKGIYVITIAFLAFGAVSAANIDRDLLAPPASKEVPSDDEPQLSHCTNPSGVIDEKRIHECDCAKYYLCAGDLGWVLVQCQGGLHFSSARKVCVAPNEADCLPKLNENNEKSDKLVEAQS
ncbi:PREDICTED: uncharacterized protein LOC105565054 [Vollenhovia emeryi]|uniref:uncharacterized protein LOC105565054 n=1 Tax=Vollenhovia emeryi TaxID=411798 RepID=UPI0005F44C35|nr:PREDICTED: uncharacterized protein LOC105565054 [Vollenhovia emeryi]